VNTEETNNRRATPERDDNCEEHDATAKRSKELKNASSCRRRNPPRGCRLSSLPQLTSTFIYSTAPLYEFCSPPRSSSSLPVPSPCARYSRARVAMCYAPAPLHLGGVNMKCTNGQPAGYRRHREQRNPNAASRDQNGASKNPLHHRGFYWPPRFSCKSPHTREPTSGLDPLTPAHYECAVMRCKSLHRIANPAFLGKLLCLGLLCVAPSCVPGGVRVVSRAPSYPTSTRLLWAGSTTSVVGRLSGAAGRFCCRLRFD
jgi:hypothetical protein